MYKRPVLCADRGQDRCPCVLSEHGECMTCSMLAGRGECDCGWDGVCIYNEYVHNGSAPVKPKCSISCDIQKKIMYDEDLAVMRIKVPAGLAEEASLPGSYVFVRSPGADPFFDMPVSVMRACYGEGTIDIAVKRLGVKSGALLSADAAVMLRGVYRNGLIGADILKSPDCRRVLCLAKGTGLAPAVNYCRWAAGRSEIDMIIDTDKITADFAEACLSGCITGSVRYDGLPLGDMGGKADKYDAVIICASDYYQENLLIPAEKKVITNNHIMCCGEGICGACSAQDSSGRTVRMCKCR